MLSLMEAIHRRVQANDSDDTLPDVLYIPEGATSTPSRIDHLVDHVQLGGTQILRIQTPIGVSLSATQMHRLMTALHTPSTVWGLNMGELSASDDAWVVFAEELPRTSVGFVWVNECGKDIGASAATHRWLLGIGVWCEHVLKRVEEEVDDDDRQRWMKLHKTAMQFIGEYRMD